MDLEAPLMSAISYNATDLSPSALALQDAGPYTLTDLIFTLRCYLYIWTPSEMAFKTVEEVPNMLIRLVRYMPLMMFFELIGLTLRGRKLPRWNHSLMSFCTVTMLFLPSAIIGNVELTWFKLIWERYRIVDIAYDSKLAWVACLLCCDLGGYVWHRAAHEVNFFWAYHSVHHTSDDLNLSAAYRLSSFNRQMAIMFYLPLALIFPPAMFYIHYQLSYTYGLWVHTDSIDGPDWIGYFIVTPKLHRVHHARNRYCIDKNYGATLMIWDVLFGTYANERKDIPLSFGLVTRHQGFDVISVQFKYFIEMFKRASTYDNFTDKFYTFVKGPGWEPGKPRLGNDEDIPQIYEGDDDISYEKKSPTWVYVYLTWTISMMVTLFSTVSTTKEMLGTGVGIIQCLYILWAMANAGYFLEHKPWVPTSEVIRCASYVILELLIGPSLMVYPLFMHILRYTSIISLFIWSFKLNMFCAKDTIKHD